MIEQPVVTADDPVTGASVRILAVGSEAAAFREFTRHASMHGATVTRIADDGPALRAMLEDPHDLVIVLLEDNAADHMGWWAEALGRLPRPPRLAALARHPSITLAVQAAHRDHGGPAVRAQRR